MERQTSATFRPGLLSLGLLRLPGLALARRLLRHLLSRRPRLGQADRDRLLAALDLAAGPAASQGTGLALLHRPLDRGAGLLGIFACFTCHDRSPLASDQSARLEIVPFLAAIAVGVDAPSQPQSHETIDPA